jgi:hypothetical protein
VIRELLSHYFIPFGQYIPGNTFIFPFWVVALLCAIPLNVRSDPELPVFGAEYI